MDAEPRFDPEAYPRTYRPSLGWRLFLGLFGVAALVGGLVAGWYFGAGHEARTSAAMYLMIGMSMSLALFGLYCLAIVVRGAVVLTAQAIEERGVFKVKRMERGDVAGYRTLVVQGTKALVLTRKSDGKRAMKISMAFKRDRLFDAWFAGLVNLDAADFNAELSDLEKDRSLGITPRQVSENLERARKFARALNGLAFACMWWAILYPRPYELVIALVAALPWVAFVLCMRGGRLFTIEDPGKSTARANLTTLLIGPGVVLALRALRDVNLIAPTDLLIPAIIGGVCMTGLAVWIAPGLRQKLPKLALYVLFLGAYSGGAIALANELLDHANGTAFRVVVLGKHRTTGRGATQYLTVSAWGSRQRENEVQVPPYLYLGTYVGQSVCIVQRHGDLGLRWYYVSDRCAG